ncbi:LPXTG cell wall anchor domain-containing protein [Lentzea sp. E54]|uniref:LPXTG cell wall anchor domain-containing protein n=1 Tax=Lentzea xerophila TaxID=3435883 RepID=UPI003DA37369
MTTPATRPPVHQDNRLADTGASTTWMLLLGVLLLVGGTALLLLDRARRLSRR